MCPGPSPGIGNLAGMAVTVVDVQLGERSYPVMIGSGASGELAAVVPQSARRAAIVTQPNIGVVVDPGIEHEVFLIEDGERAKTLDTVGDLCSRWARWGLTRADVVIGVGGGLVTDVAGFAASVYHRGIPAIHVATTLLGQIDAAVGGKTGVNLAEGKNLVGSFWQPTAVLCDTDVLRSLPRSEWRCGYGEMAKYHFLGTGDLGDLDLVDQIVRCVRLKADVVGGDEREAGRRAVLNYGHTLAHALEISGGFGLKHGEAVAVGLVYAAEVAHRLGRIDADRVAEHRRVVTGYELDYTLPSKSDSTDIITLFSKDKKALSGLTFVLDGPEGIETTLVDDESVLRAALEAMR